MTDETRSCAPTSMVLLTRLAKQVYRRSNEELLGMHMRLLMALSYVRDHDNAPQQELGRRCAWTPTTSCCCSTS